MRNGLNSERRTLNSEHRTSCIFAVLLLIWLLAGQNRAFGSPAFTLPRDVPTLDSLAGDWKTGDELAQYPSIHNFKAELLVNKDFTAAHSSSTARFQSLNDSAGILTKRCAPAVPAVWRFKPSTAWYLMTAVCCGG